MINVGVLEGRLTVTPKLNHTGTGVACVTFTLAVDRTYIKAGTERQVDFLDVVAWRGNAEFACKYFHQGQLMGVSGYMQSRSYKDTQGNKRKAVELVAERISFAGNKQNDSDASANEHTNRIPAATQPTDYIEYPSDADIPVS